MQNLQCLKNSLPILLLPLLLFGCAYPNAITEDNRNTPIEGHGFRLMPPREGNQWRYGTEDRLGLAGFFKFATVGDEATMTIVQGWVASERYYFFSEREVARALWSGYNRLDNLGLKFSRYELTETQVDGQKVQTLQVWGTHEFPRAILTIVVRFNGIFYVLPSPDGKKGEYLILGGWISRMTQGDDNPLDLKTDWTFVKEMLDGVLPAAGGSTAPFLPHVARPFVVAKLVNNNAVFYRFLH